MSSFGFTASLRLAASWQLSEWQSWCNIRLDSLCVRRIRFTTGGGVLSRNWRTCPETLSSSPDLAYSGTVQLSVVRIRFTDGLKAPGSAKLPGRTDCQSVLQPEFGILRRRPGQGEGALVEHVHATYDERTAPPKRREDFT